MYMANTGQSCKNGIFTSTSFYHCWVNPHVKFAQTSSTPEENSRVVNE